MNDHLGDGAFPSSDLTGWEEMAVAVMDALGREGLTRRELPHALEVSLVDDATIADIHQDFMKIPGPTDVITFPYGELGEIFIGVETARRQAREFGRTLPQEISLYLIHGILHLAGYDDQTDDGASEMDALQEDLLTQYGKGMDTIHTDPKGPDSVD